MEMKIELVEYVNCMGCGQPVGNTDTGYCTECEPEEDMSTYDLSGVDIEKQS